jgi:hypothetical protein
VSRYELEFVTQGGKELVQVRLFGQADHANLEALIAELDAAVRDRHPIGILVDESELKPGLIGVDDVRTIVVRWRKANDLRAARIAVFAPNPLVFGLNRLVESLAARDKRMTMRAFRERGSALGWLMGFSAIS